MNKSLSDLAKKEEEEKEENNRSSMFSQFGCTADQESEIKWKTDVAILI